MSPTQEAAMKMALEALEVTAVSYPVNRHKAAVALRAALKETAQDHFPDATKMVQEPVACLIGTKGSAFDSPTTKRAYTYAEQPGNVVASRLGLACNAAASQSAGDSIDRGLGLLQELQRQGFGVFDLGAEYAAPPQRPAEPVQEPVAWGLFAKVGGKFVLQHPVRFSEIDVEDDRLMYARDTVTEIRPLYIAPPQRLPLPEKEIFAIENDIPDDVISDRAWTIWLSRAVEKAHGIK